MDLVGCIGRSYVDIGHVGDGSGESLLDGDFIHGARHYRDITNDVRETLDRLMNAERQRHELLSACKRDADTFRDLSIVMRLLRHDTSAKACDIAEAGARAAIANCERGQG